MGGVFAVLPAYEADLYGTKYIGAIHGRLVDFIFPSDCFQNIVLADFWHLRLQQLCLVQLFYSISKKWQRLRLSMVHTSTSMTTWIKLSEHKMMTISPTDLLTKVDPQVFTAKFGCGLDGAQSLVEAKTLTISKLMTIMPPGTVDPRYIYVEY